jgi:hypothetical protein
LRKGKLRKQISNFCSYVEFEKEDVMVVKGGLFGWGEPTGGRKGKGEVD